MKSCVQISSFPYSLYQSLFHAKNIDVFLISQRTLQILCHILRARNLCLYVVSISGNATVFL